jgi:hypothetical protein
LNNTFENSVVLPLPAALVNVPALANVPEGPETPSISEAALPLKVAPASLLNSAPSTTLKFEESVQLTVPWLLNVRPSRP